MYDIIGDIHGYADALSALLYHLGYRFRNGAWRFPGARRTVLFVGDFLDRGPEIPATLVLVHRMLDAGSAIAVMGNHEYNAIAWHTPDGRGGWLRGHSRVHRNQHRATLEQFGIDAESPLGDYGVLEGGRTPGGGPLRLRRELEWLRALPLYLETDTLRVVHAAWEIHAVEAVAEISPQALLDDRFLQRSAYGQYRESRAVEVLLKGIEIPLPAGTSYRDKDGARRNKTRVRWWIDPANASSKLADIAMPPADRQLRHLSVQPGVLAMLPGYHDEHPVFFGHYWFTGRPAPVAPRVACLDYSIAQGGILCAYRFEGDPVLSAERFVAVDARGRLVG